MARGTRAAVMPSRLRRALLTAAAVLLFLVLAGATYQGVATALERRRFPHPGQLVDLGGHQLHIYCTGEGSPTVVLEAPATGMSAAWGWVQPEVAVATRVCSYDRAGLGWSEAGGRPYQPAAVAGDLRALLQGAGERAPYVIVGQGLGAAFASLHAATLGADVAALVLIDAPAPGALVSQLDPRVSLVDASPWLARAGVLRATRLLSGDAAGLPAASAGALAAFLNRPDHLTRSARELSLWDDTMRLAEAAALDPSLPVLRITAPDSGSTAFLTEPDAARAVSTGIISVVTRVDPAR